MSLASANAARWAAAKLTRSGFDAVARRLVAGKARFQAMEKRTGVPWFVIAVIKQRESGDDLDWLGNIANGQPWSKKTTIVPKGRGPFASWEDAAYDALVNCAPYAAKNTDWSAGGTLALLERYNGLGYANKGKPSPYIWSGTDQYVKGKYVKDGVYDPNAVDKQLGCAGLILAMQKLDPSIRFGGALPAFLDPAAKQPPAAAQAAPQTSAHAAAAGGTVAVVATTAAAGAVQQGVSAAQVVMWIGGVSAIAVAAIIIGYRIIKGAWPWTSTGKASPEASLLSPPQSAPSLADLSAAQLALASAGLQAAPSLKSSASTRPRKRSAKPSPKTRTRSAKSSSSKPTAAKKFARKRSSKSSD